MTRRRWIADEVVGDTATILGDHAAHLTRVLRAQVGQSFDVAAGGILRRGVVTFIGSDYVEFALGEQLEIPPESQVTLALSIFKFDRMEWAFEKCTEIGVSRFIPIVARRTDKHLALAAPKRLQRWQRLVLQAAEQSRRASVPEIDDPIGSNQLTALPSGLTSVRIVLSESEEEVLLRDVLQPAVSEVTLAVGPEGGWTIDELESFRGSGWKFATLGTSILRAETASIVAAAIAQDCLR